MNDPRRTDDVRQPAGEPPRESLPRKSSSPLLWILLLIALIAVGWYFYSQRGPVNAPEAPPTPIGTSPEIGDGTAQIQKLVIAREKVGRVALQYDKRAKGAAK